MTDFEHRHAELARERIVSLIGEQALVIAELRAALQAHNEELQSVQSQRDTALERVQALEQEKQDEGAAKVPPTPSEGAE